MTLLAERGFDVSGFTPDLMTSADDVFCFPNMVGPVYPGQRVAVPRAPERSRSELGDQGHVGARVAASGHGVADARAPLLRRLARAQVGRDHRAGLHESRQRAAGHALTRLRRFPAREQAGEQRPAHAPGGGSLSDAERPIAQPRPRRCSRSRSAKRARSLAMSLASSGGRSSSRSGRHQTRRRTPSARVGARASAPSASRSTADPCEIRTNRGIHFGERSDCARRNATKPSASNVGAFVQVHRDHHLVADLRRRHRVDRGEHDVGVARDHLLDGRGREVLAVDAQPVGVAARRSRRSRRRRGSRGRRSSTCRRACAARWLRGCCSSPRSCRRRRDSRSRRSPASALSSRPCSSNSRACALHAGVGVDDLGAKSGDRHAERTGRRVVGLRHVDAALGRAVAVDDVAAEALREAVDVERRGLVAEPDAQRASRRRRAAPASRGCR